MSTGIEALETRGERIDLPSRWGDVVWRVWGDGPPVVLLHGGTGSWLHWVATIPALESTHRLLVPDLPGMGDSADIEQREPVEALIEEMGRVIHDGVLELEPGRRPVHTIGFSFGAMVGAFTAASLGARARTYTMLGASGLGLGFPGLGRLAKIRPAAGPDEVREAHRNNMASIMFSDPGQVTEEALATQLHNAARVRVRSHTAAATRVMLEPLGRVSAQKHAIWGEKDPYLPHDGEALDRVLDGLRCSAHLIPGAGHWVAYERAAACNRLLQRILAA